MEPKAKTLQERFGFTDPELTTPQHDAIMLWLDRNIERLISEGIFGRVTGGGWGEVDVDSYRERANRLYQDACTQIDTHNQTPEKDRRYGWSAKPELPLFTGLGDPSAMMEPPSVTKTWEFPVTKDSDRPFGTHSGGFIIGFIDLLVRYSLPILRLANTRLKDLYTYDANGNRKWVEVLEDGCLPAWSVCWSEERPLAFEVKPKIRSLGEVIRQIRMYEQHWRKPRYIVVSPDDRFAEQLKQQDIGFLKGPT